MKLFLRSLALSAGFLLSAHGFAQTSAAAPATKPAASAPAATTGAMPAKPAAPAMKAPKSASKMATTEAPGGGAGKVWVNTASKTYHCPGTKYYGKTKAGEYMTEAEAKAKGNHPDHKKACS